MIEISTPAVPESSFRNTTDFLVARAANHAAQVAFQVRTGNSWRDVTTREFADTVTSVAKGLIAVGVRPGNAVAVVAETRYEWAVVDMATWYAGAVVVPVYPTSSVVQAAGILADSAPVLAFVGSALSLIHISEPTRLG